MFKTSNAGQLTKFLAAYANASIKTLDGEMDKCYIEFECRIRLPKTQIAHYGFSLCTLDLIDSGDLSATLAQDTWRIGFWDMVFVYMVANQWIEPVADWRAAGVSPLPPNVDTGVVVINQSNSQYWRAAKYWTPVKKHSEATGSRSLQPLAPEFL